MILVLIVGILAMVAYLKVSDRQFFLKRWKR